MAASRPKTGDAVEAGFATRNAHFFDTEKLDKSSAIAALKKEVGIGEELIEAYFHPYLYLNHEVIEANGQSVDAFVEAAVAAASARPGASG